MNELPVRMQEEVTGLQITLARVQTAGLQYGAELLVVVPESWSEIASVTEVLGLPATVGKVEQPVIALRYKP